MSKDLTTHCDHISWSGAEGPIVDLGRWPVLWQCDGCGALEVNVIFGCKTPT